jgi:hypothetical protein
VVTGIISIAFFVPALSGRGAEMKANDIPDKSQREIIPKLLKPQSPGRISFDNPAPVFLSMGTGFTVYGVPLAEDTALLDTGIDLALGPRTTAGVSYSGQSGDGVSDNGVKGRFTWLF